MDRSSKVLLSLAIIISIAPASTGISLFGTLDASSYTGTDQNEGLNLVDNGTELYLANGAYTAPSDIIHWRLSDPYNLSSATHIETVSVKSTADNLRGFDINPEGTKFWIMEATSNDIHEFDLSTAYDISSKSKCCKYYVGSQTTSPRRLDVKSPVDKFWMAPGNPVYEYSSGGSSVSGGSYTSTTYNFDNDGFNGEMDWGENGNKLFLYDFNSGTTGIFTASNAFDIGTVSYDNTNYSTGSEVSGRGDINLVDSDNRIYAVGTSDIINHFSISTNNAEPTIDIESPNNVNKNPSGGVELEVNVSEPTNEKMNVTFYDASDDSEIGKIENVNNGTYSTTWTGLIIDKTYNWYANVTDGSNTVKSPTSTFTTIDITLNWNDNSDNEDGFKIYSNATGTLQQVATAPADSISKTVYNPGLEFGKNTTYKISAYNQYGESDKVKGYITP